MVWRASDPQGNEASKIMWEIVPFTNGRTLDLGCGPYKPFKHFIGVDNMHHAQAFNWEFKPDVHVDTCENLDLFASESCHAVFSSHLLEHIKDYKAALKEWWRMVKPGGYLILYLPHKDYYPNIGEENANKDHKHDFVPQDIVDAMQATPGWDLLENQTRSGLNEYSFFQVYRKRTDDKIFIAKKTDKKTAAVIRYGAFGDIIMASSILPGLKEQGYHITVYTVKNAWEVIKNDPHVDRFIVQGADQVPNHQLGPFWHYLSSKYDKFINLSESVEGTWLALPGRSAHSWPADVRRKYLKQNYIEFAHDLAGVPMPCRSKFYATDEEKKWARITKRRMAARAVVWSLAGSSVHKAWPHVDRAISRILYAYKNVKVVLVGDGLCKILEAGWGEEPRVFCRSGEWNIRQSMAFCDVADLIIGTETGLLNASGMLETPKICMLSHSSKENLTKHWKNTISMVPDYTPCYPCHRMHYGWEFCHKDSDSSSALCQHNITLPMVWKAIVEKLGPVRVECPPEEEGQIVLHDGKALIQQEVLEAIQTMYGPYTTPNKITDYGPCRETMEIAKEKP